MTRAIAERQGDARHAKTGAEQEQGGEGADRLVELSRQCEDAGADHAVGGNQDDSDQADMTRRNDASTGGLAHPAINFAASGAW